MEAPGFISDSNNVLSYTSLLNLASFLLFELLFILTIIVNLSENIFCQLCIVFYSTVVLYYNFCFQGFLLIGKGKPLPGKRIWEILSHSMNPDFQEYFVTVDLKYVCNKVEQ